MKERFRQEDLSAESLWLSMGNASLLADVISKKKARTKLISEDNGKSKMLKVDMLNIFHDREINEKIMIGFFQSKQMKLFALKLTRDMYENEFNLCSSVVSKIDKSNIPVNESYATTSNSTLLEHTFGVVNMMKRVCETRYGLYGDFFYLSALVHDFGKSFVLNTKYSLDHTLKHHQKSAEYLKIIVENTKDLSSFHKDIILKNVVPVINAHHSNELRKSILGTDESQKSLKKEEQLQNSPTEFKKRLLNALIAADTQQRARELVEYSE